MVINQAMKREPMAVYRIRNILTGIWKSQNQAPLFTNSLLAGDSSNTTSGRRTAHSLTDEVELPVEEYMGTTFRPKSILRYRSVPADVGKVLNNSLVEQSKIRTNDGDESILRGLPNNSAMKWTGAENMDTTKRPGEPKPIDSVSAVHQPDQEELGSSVPELTLASMRNNSSKIGKHHSCSCENVSVNM